MSVDTATAEYVQQTTSTDFSNREGFDCPSCCHIRWTKALGLHVVAARDLPAGAQLWCEQPYGSVVLDEAHDSVCHWCWKPLVLGQPRTTCRSCHYAVYCSENCRTQDRSDQHEYLCPMVELAGPIATSSGVTVNRVRLLMKCLVAKYLEQERPKLKLFQTEQACGAALASSRSISSSEEVEDSSESNAKNSDEDGDSDDDNDDDNDDGSDDDDGSYVNNSDDSEDNNNSYNDDDDDNDDDVDNDDDKDKDNDKDKDKDNDKDKNKEGDKDKDDHSDHHSDRVSSPKLVLPRFSDVLAMETNRAAFSSDWIESVQAAAELILTLSPPEMAVATPDELVNLALISDTNAFGITIDQPQPPIPTTLSLEPQSSVPSSKQPPGSQKAQSASSSSLARPSVISSFVGGFGLFPLCAKLNHSCFPNCQFGLATTYGDKQQQSVAHHASLTMRTLRFVSRGEELTDSYIDLYSDRISRRSELLRTKHFLCKCSRCVQPIELSFDRYLSGYICRACNTKNPTSAEGETHQPEQVEQNCNELKWNDVLADIGESLSGVELIMPNLTHVARLIIVDLSLMELGKQKQVSTEKETSPKNYANVLHSFGSFSPRLLVEPAKLPVAPGLDDPSSVSILLPPVIDPELGVTLTDELDLIFVQQGAIPPHLTTKEYRCEKCDCKVDYEALEDAVSDSEMLQAQIVSSFPSSCVSYDNALQTRQSIAKFLKYFGRDLFHPFHSWIYRISQQLVDTSKQIIARLDPLKTSFLQSRLCTLLMDLILLRHQKACQSIVFPEFHQEKLLTFRVLTFILHQIVTEFPLDLLQSYDLDVEILSQAFYKCASMYESNREILYGS